MTISLERIARPTKTFAMVAMDQRDSLRTMFLRAGLSHVPDSLLTSFKLEVARTLAPHGSAFLIDRDYGFDAVRDEQILPAHTGLILAADVLHHEPTQPIEDTSLDYVVINDMDLSGVDAIKLLLIWRDDERRAQRIELAREFAQAAHNLGLLSVLEPVVRPTARELAAGTWNQEKAVREAARELSTVGQSLYKVQVPLAGRAEPARLQEEMQALNEAITGPWVVLSQGVAIEDFPTAVLTAAQAGASGFLAGRALWSDVVGREGDTRACLEKISVPRLKQLGEIVDAYATPWDLK